MEQYNMDLDLNDDDLDVSLNEHKMDVYLGEDSNDEPGLIARRRRWNNEPECVCVLYPGNVKNEHNAIRNLGGITAISKTFCREEKFLKLRFHPESPYCKPAMAECRSKPIVIFSVKEKRSKRDPTKPPQFEINIIKRCIEYYKFKGCCDIQELPIATEQSITKNQKEPLKYQLVRMPENATDINYLDYPNGVVFTLPNLFLRNIVTDSSVLNSKPDDEEQSTIVTQRSTLVEKPINITFSMNEKLPVAPESSATIVFKAKHVKDEQLQMLRDMFEKTPIWTRIALIYETKFTFDRLRILLPSVAYHFLNGPWRSTYVRLGYDPRIDFGSRSYQIFDFRLRIRSGFAQLVPNRHDSIKRKLQYPAEISEEIVQDIDYPYLDEGRLPRSRQCILRYCDVRIRKVQEMLEKIPTPLTGAVCNEKTGWLPIGFDAQVREVLTVEIMEVMRQYYRRQEKNNFDKDTDLEILPGDDNDSDKDYGGE